MSQFRARILRTWSLKRRPDRAVASTDNRRSGDSLAAMEGLCEVQVGGAFRSWGVLRTIYPGLIAALMLATAAEALSRHYGVPVTLLALLLGMAFHFLDEGQRCRPGLDFASQQLLRVGVALLGARITLAQVAYLGVLPIATVAVGLVTTIGLGVILARRLGLGAQFGVLSGGAVGICGASAALAIASVLPPSPERERDTTFTVITVTTLSTLAMIFYPIVVTMIGLKGWAAGMFLGATIHDVAQVVGAGYAVSADTAYIAIYVKLLRVSLLIPVVLCIVVLWRHGIAAKPVGRVRLPLFLLGFAALVVVNSAGLLSSPTAAAATAASQWCLATAIAALGVKTTLKGLLQVGWRPLVLIVTETVWIAGLTLVAVLIFQ